jgi:hypothetical protein
MRFWGLCRRDGGCGRCLSVKGCGIFIRRRDKIGTLGFDFDATVTGTGTGDQFTSEWARRKKLMPKKTTAVAVATTPKEMRLNKVPRLVPGVPVPPFGRSEGAPGALAGCEPEFRRELRGSSCCASSTNNPVASVRRDISRSRFPDNRSQNTNGEC